MQHTTWLRNRMPSHALKGQTPFEMKLKRKPNLANIQEFGAAAYVKDLKARKLDLRALVGRFIGYDIESKGYQIYWPSKRTVSVERNVCFNENDVTTSENITITSGDTLAEGESVRGHPFRPPSPTPTEYLRLVTPDISRLSNTLYVPPHCR